MKSGKSFGVKLIAGFYIFGGAVLILSLLFGGVSEIGIATRLGLPENYEVQSKIGLAALSFIMSYGLLKFSRWGIWLFVVYNLLFLTVSSNLYSHTKEQLYSGNMFWSILMLIYMFMKRKEFTNN